MELSNNNFLTVVSYLQAELCKLLVRMLEKMISIRNNYVNFVYVVLGFIMEGFPLAISHDRLSLARDLGRH